MSEIFGPPPGMKPNPTFGGGYFVRSTAMRRRAPDQLEVVMEDSSHALALLLTHDDRTLVRVDARWVRAPISACAGAAAFLGGMAGTPLTDDLQALGVQVDARSHCTHMFDSCRFGIAHIAAGRPDRRYDVVLPDTTEGPQPVRLLIDGALDMAMEIDRTMTIQSPPNLAGAPLMRGFAGWARDRLSPALFEKLVIIQRGVFVARGRQIDAAYYDGGPARELGPPESSCYASQPSRYDLATRTVATLRPDLKIEDAARFTFDRPR